jgi:hypothetical protein
VGCDASWLLLRTDVLEECITSIIRVTRIGELGTILAVINNHALVASYWLLVTANNPSLPILITLMMEAIHSFETSILTRAKWHNIPEDGILQA